MNLGRRFQRVREGGDRDAEGEDMEACQLKSCCRRESEATLAVLSQACKRDEMIP